MYSDVLANVQDLQEVSLKNKELGNRIERLEDAEAALKQELETAKRSLESGAKQAAGLEEKLQQVKEELFVTKDQLHRTQLEKDVAEQQVCRNTYEYSNVQYPSAAIQLFSRCPM